MAKILPTTERGCFLVRNQYPNGHVYWHGFAEKKAAEEFAKPFRELEVQDDIYYGAVTMNDMQARECHNPKGCALDQTQLSKFLREVDHE